MHRQHELRTGLLPGVTIPQPIIRFLNLKRFSDDEDDASVNVHWRTQYSDLGQVKVQVCVYFFTQTHHFQCPFVNKLSHCFLSTYYCLHKILIGPVLVQYYQLCVKLTCNRPVTTNTMDSWPICIDFYADADQQKMYCKLPKILCKYKMYFLKHKFAIIRYIIYIYI